MWLRAVLLSPLLLAAPAAQAAQAVQLTAVFTLDALPIRLSGEAEESLAERLEARVAECSITPGKEPLYRLDCPPEPAGPESPGRPATLALFRDLHETVYLAACPFFDPLDKKRRRSDPDAEDIEIEGLEGRLCGDIEAGRAFSAEVHGDDELRIVIRGRQLRLRLYETRPRPRRISSSYTPKPSRGALGHAGPPTSSVARSAAGTALSSETPEWRPPTAEDRSRHSGGESRRAALRAPAPAKTSLRVGTLTLTCPFGTDVWLDEAHIGACPIRMPLAAGRHELLFRRGGRTLEVREIQLEAGETLSVRIKR